MVRGLSIFQEWFKDYESHYVLIGGTAAKITMEEAGANFPGTRDLDIVLHVEALTPEFGRHFWEFVVAGGGDIFQLFGQDIEVRMNWSDGWQSSPETKPSIDFVKSFVEGVLLHKRLEPLVDVKKIL
jgi:hypothetical protein